MGKKIRELKKELLSDEGFRREYDALEEEFSMEKRNLFAELSEAIGEIQRHKAGKITLGQYGAKGAVKRGK